MKKFFIGVFSVLSLALASCSGSGEHNASEYLPFKSSENGKWGMVSVDGEVLFEEEFTNQPTEVKNGRFLVRNNNGLWEMFTAEENPRKIGEDYKHICEFNSDVTLAVKEGERITIINKEGEVVKTIEKIKGKEIISAYMHNNIVALETEDKKFVFMDTKGNIIEGLDSFEEYERIKSISHDVIALLKKKDCTDDGNTWTVMNTNGEELLSIKEGSKQKYTDIDFENSTDEYLLVARTVDGEEQWGIIDYKKEEIVRPSSKIRGITGIRGDKFIFKNSEGLRGVMNMESEVVLRPKYDVLIWVDDNLLQAHDAEDGYMLTNLDGEKLTKEKYLSMGSFNDGDYATVKITDNSWGFIDKNGEVLKLKNAPDFYYIGGLKTRDEVESEFVDLDAITGPLKLTENGMLGFNLDMTPLQIINAYNELSEEYEKIDPTPAGAGYRDNVRGNLKSTRRAYTSYKVYYTNYMTNREYNYYNYETVYSWAKVKPKYVSCNISCNFDSKLRSKLYNKITSLVKTFGKVQEQNENHVIVLVNNSVSWEVVNGSNICVTVTGDGGNSDDSDSMVAAADSCANNTASYY